MVGRPACRSPRTEAQRSRASFATRKARNSRRTKRALNTSAEKIGAMIRLVIRNSDSAFGSRELVLCDPLMASAAVTHHRLQLFP